ncbi:M48 family peptidase [Puteibacter caeruleilacunae]|nr:M48 family peptidase [Puteibacter caeruleilacunae]
MAKQTIRLEEIGEVTLQKRRNAVNLRISLSSEGKVNVSMPTCCPYEEAIKFVQAKSEWIINHQQKIKKRTYVFTPDDELKIREYTLVLRKGVERGKCKSGLEGQNLVVVYPPDLGYEHEWVQGFIRKNVIELLRMEAKFYLPYRVEELAKKHNFTYNRVFVKNLKTKWGSCSAARNINLNIHLMRLPDELIDYIILHELAHTKELNHSKRFWDILHRIYGDASIIDAEMKKYRVDFLE